MHLELRRRRTHRRQRCYRGDLPRPQVKPGAAVDVAEGKFQEVGRKVRRDVGERGDNLFAGMSVDFSERALAAIQPAFADALVVVCHSCASSVERRHSRQSWCRGR